MLFLFQTTFFMKRLFTATLFLLAFAVSAQDTYPVNGPRVTAEGFYCFINATIYVSADKKLDNASLVIRRGRIEDVGTGITIPKGAVVVDLAGKHVYPSFIDLHTSYGLAETARQQGGGYRGPQYESSKKGAYYWNESIHPEYRAAEVFKADPKVSAEYRSAGFGAVLSHLQDGIARGTSVFTTLSDKRENESVLITDAAQHFSFRKGNSNQAYPSSLMGSIALLTQTYYDAKWYAAQKQLKEENLSLQALNRWHNLPQIFDANDKYNVLRADKIGDQFGVQYVFKTNGKEYQRLNEIKSSKGTLIVPLNFPDPYDVEDTYDAMNVSLEDMKHWELAPYNPSLLHKSQIRFVLTSSDLKEKKQFLPNLRKAVRYGLPEAEALKALTVYPAQLLGVDKQLGTLEKGKVANFIICSEQIFSEKASIQQNWGQGNLFVIQVEDPLDIRGDYDVNIENNIYSLSVKGGLQELQASLKVDTTQVKAKVSLKNRNVSVSFIVKDKNYNGAVRLTGVVHQDGGVWDGNGELPNGNRIKWNAIRKAKFKEENKPSVAPKDSLNQGRVWFPVMAYGWDSLPRQGQVLIKNITVWTNEKEGVLKNTDVLLRDGKIFKIGRILDVVDKSTWVIDGTGKHLTAGIVDEHSHIAISGGVNEGTHAVTAEVNISDVVNSDDVNIYRQLGGGVTAAQLLHGSANPIGGRSALIKLKWGHTPDEMLIKDAPGFIKFALGENVKQSNWGEQFSTRYPQTRMGVEQVFYDAFLQAKAYEKEWKKVEQVKGKFGGELPRRDIQMDVLVEILNSKRFISCHSYVQSEINMLMKVADSMGFKINTFTHILEGYKVADKMLAHGVAASTFSDWWAYKYEVIEAIPYNAALMHKVGVLTGINSDDAEMARRLNQEAAKAVKYGDVSEEEALKMVTLNPAKMLHLDHRIGSIKVGKDADLVIWSDHPLSIYAKAERTFIEGVCYFDIDRDRLLRERNMQERNRLIGKMIAAKQGGAPTQRPQRPSRRLYHCESLEEYNEEFE